MPTKPIPKKKPWQTERVPFARRSTDNTKFYNSRAWRLKSKQYKEKHPICVKCEAVGVVTAVQYTDHIIRLEDGGSEFADCNLQSLCAHHHNSKSGKEAHGYKEGMGSKHPDK